MNELQRIRLGNFLLLVIKHRDNCSYIKDNELHEPNLFHFKNQLLYTLVRSPQSLKTTYMDITMDYEYEYVGCNSRLIVTPNVNTCWAAALQAGHSQSSLCLMGASQSGKTQLMRDLSQQLGKFCVVVSCNQWFSYKTLHQIFLGVSQTGVEVDNLDMGRAGQLQLPVCRDSVHELPTLGRAVPLSAEEAGNLLLC